jgi:hypothetical protein
MIVAILVLIRVEWFTHTAFQAGLISDNQEDPSSFGLSLTALLLVSQLWEMGAAVFQKTPKVSSRIDMG